MIKTYGNAWILSQSRPCQHHSARTAVLEQLKKEKEEARNASLRRKRTIKPASFFKSVVKLLETQPLQRT